MIARRVLVQRLLYGDKKAESFPCGREAPSRRPEGREDTSFRLELVTVLDAAQPPDLRGTVTERLRDQEGAAFTFFTWVRKSESLNKGATTDGSDYKGANPVGVLSATENCSGSKVADRGTVVRYLLPLWKVGSGSSSEEIDDR